MINKNQITFINKNMTNLRDFINQKNTQHASDQNETSSAPNTSNKDFEKLINDDPQKVENIQENLKKYQNMSQSDLMSELIKEASRMKQNGSLNDNSLNVLKSTLMPMLNDQQKNMLHNILNQIR